MKNIFFKIKSKKNIQAKIFLACLFISMILWLLVNLSKVYRTKVTLVAAYQNPPPGMILFNDKTDTLHMEISTTGLQILRYNLKIRKVKVDLDKVLLTNGSNYFWLPNRSLSILRSDLGVKDVFRVKEDTISFIMDKELRKKVPITSKIKLLIRQGFKIIKTYFSNDSIQIKGPATLVKKINTISTEPIEINDVHTNINRYVSLYYPSKIEGQLKVNYKVLIEKYTEKSLRVKINPINLPIHTQVQIIPDQTQIKFTVGYSKYDQIKAQDFQIACDLKKIGDTIETFPLQVLKSPVTVENIRLIPPKVKVVLIREQ